MAMSFDIDAYRRGTSPVEYEDLDYGAFRTQPLSAGALRCLRYMCDIESHTVCYLRDLLVTPSHADPEVTTFLTMWAFEEYWHGEALARVLAAHGIATGSEHIRAVRARLGRRDRLSPVRQAIVANLVGADFIAVHMTFGAINEWSTHAGYARLAAVENHPVLTELLTRIMRQETRHVAFYVTQARMRLHRSAKARRLTRFALRAFWSPVGSSVMPEAETQHLLGFLLGGEAGGRILAKLDERVDKLPGLAGLRLMTRAMARYGGGAGALRTGPAVPAPHAHSTGAFRSV
jgi:hypothetical protein